MMLVESLTNAWRKGIINAAPSYFEQSARAHFIGLTQRGCQSIQRILVLMSAY